VLFNEKIILLLLIITLRLWNYSRITGFTYRIERLHILNPDNMRKLLLTRLKQLKLTLVMQKHGVG